jgi:hypothetical protein
VLLERSQWRAGMLEGEAGTFDAEGHPVWTGGFSHGRREGTFMAFHPNGQLRVRGDFDKGAPRGRFTGWYPDGTKAAEGRYKDSRPDGTWVCWNPKGVQMLSMSLRSGATGELDLPAELAWEPGVAPAADPFDLAAVFAVQPSSEEPALAAVILPPTRKPAPAPVASHAAAPAPADDGEAAAATAGRVGVN